MWSVFLSLGLWPLPRITMNDNAIFCKFWKLNRCLTVVFSSFWKAEVTIRTFLTIAQTTNRPVTHNVSLHTVLQHNLELFSLLFNMATVSANNHLTTISLPLSLSVVGGWFLPSNGPICPSSSPPQFTGSPGHSSGSYCERYSGLRSHRAAPYPSHYPHRSTTTSKACSWLMQPPWCTWGRNITNSFIIEVTSLQMEIQD